MTIRCAWKIPVLEDGARIGARSRDATSLIISCIFKRVAGLPQLRQFGERFILPPLVKCTFYPPLR